MRSAADKAKGDRSVRPGPMDIVPPAEIARLVQDVGVKKAGLTTVQTLTLGILAGAFIAFGAMFFTVAVTGSELGFGPTRVLGGLVFSLGLILVIIGGAELFTGNSLIVLAWVERRISSTALMRNWSIVYLGNLFGAVGCAVLVHFSGALELGDGSVRQTAVAIGEAKVALGFVQALLRGILCNMLVCLAVWMCFAARTVIGKAVVIVFPISAFVALGFEHSIANMYVIPVAALQTGSSIGLFDSIANLVAVTIGNVIGGGVLVALVYWIIYIREVKTHR